MRYTDLQIGKTYAGTIKGTYAEIFDKDGQKLWSLQAKDLKGEPAVIATDIRKVRNSNERNIPVTLTADALNVIIKQAGAKGKNLSRMSLYAKHAAFDWKEIAGKPVITPTPDPNNPVVNPDINPNINPNAGEEPSTERKPSWKVLAAVAAGLYLLFRR